MNVCSQGLCLSQGLDGQNAFCVEAPGSGSDPLLRELVAMTSSTGLTHVYLVVTFLR